MNKVYIILLITFFMFSCSNKQEKETRTDSKSTTELESLGLGYKQPRESKNSKRVAPRIEALFTINPDALNLSDLNKVTSVFDDITKITFQMINASGAKQDQLVNQANRIVKRYGYKNLKDYGIHLEEYTWAAGTYLRLQTVNEVFADNSQSETAKIMEKSLKSRLKKQKISSRDLDLIRSNWYKIDKVLKTMEEMTSAADKIDTAKHK
jgi:hypothetical protein